MDFSHLVGLFWVAMIAIGFVSSMRSSKNKPARQAAPVARPQAPTRPQPPARPQTPARRFNVTLADDVVVPPPQPTRPRASTPLLPDMPFVDTMPVKAPMRHHTAWLANKSSLIRGVIASELLGPPLSLRDPGSRH